MSNIGGNINWNELLECFPKLGKIITCFQSLFKVINALIHIIFLII